MADNHHQTVIDGSSNLLAEFLNAQVQGQSFEFLLDYQDPEIAHLLESVDNQQRRTIVETVPANRYWYILNLVQYETAKHIHKALSAQAQSERLSFISDNEVIGFADFLDSDFVDEYLLSKSAERFSQIQQALSYDENQVGRYTEALFIVANPKNSVGRIKSEIAKNNENPVRLIIVSDSTGVLGTVNPYTLLMNDDSVKLKTLVKPCPCLEDSQDIREISKQVAIDGGTQWFPVLSNGKVMGVLSMTNIALTLRELGLQAVVQENVRSEEDLFTPLTVAARMRALWLVINLITALAASAIIGVFDNVVEQVVALAILMPVVASMGGIAGSQTLAVALRGIALNHLHKDNLKLLVNKELKIACFNGVIMGLAIAVIVYFVFNSYALSAIIFCAISINSLAAALSGTLIPFTLKKFNIDPAVAGSVVLTTVTDVVGFLVFLGLGALILI